ncbi:clan AA aspartic protease (TIGR02281 family) [Novosphingobium kunmingense]|uniref:Clan AA aspartic protease (TIGR02281 family) n=1 Tax=Novosphingobium kunmingense TaxID=1211806 RepID=A0A2N0HJM6_9SPHN|nr:TIGR02281 family clan AA aspartic protease [Novosphingobium kunmingense]PKB19140.1 clan AA aspartic protease (TIGR02281 family) [Novosphingobium kunmingense]
MVNRFVVIALGAVAATAAIAPRLSTGGAGAATGESIYTADIAKAKRQGGGDELVLQRDDTGQFYLTATIGHEDVTFLVDTGADLVALTEETAERLGVLPAEDRFLPLMKTASGTGYGAPIMLDSVEIGGATYRQVEAVVMKGLATDLMGQSVLGRVGALEMTGDSMVIRPS